MSDHMSQAINRDARTAHAVATMLRPADVDMATVRRLMIVASEVPDTADRNGRTLAQRVRRLAILRQHAQR